MRLVANGATVAQRFMLEDEWAGLFAMTLSATLVHAGHREAASRLHDFVTVRIVALHAIHAVFDDRMVLREIEVAMHIKMALKTNVGIFAGIDDEPAAPATYSHVFARSPVARFATRDRGEFNVLFIKATVGAGGEGAGNISVAVRANAVTDEMRPFHLRWHVRRALNGRTGNE